MDLKKLQELGAFVSGAPVEKEIRFTLDGAEYTATIMVKRLSVGVFERAYVDKNKGKYSHSARLISEAVLLDGGREQIPLEQAEQLQTPVANAMMEAFYEVNGGKKASPTPTS